MPLNLIDVGDGTLIVPPPRTPDPPLPAAAPPPSLPPAEPPPRPIVQPGHNLIDVGDGTLIAPPPAIVQTPAGGGGTDGSGGSDDDEAAARAEAEANDPDLSDLGELFVTDILALQFDSLEGQPLKGGGAVKAIAQACADYGLDALAVIADGLHEGANGGIGDNGTSYGPFQMRIGGALPAPYSQRGSYNKSTNAWAWTDNGIRYAVRGMAAAKPSAKGLHGHAAVYAIVYGYERPADKPGAYKTRAAEYDHLVKMGSDWPTYAADHYAGPVGGGAVDTGLAPGGSGEAYRPAGVNAQWRGLYGFFAEGVPSEHAKVKALAGKFVGVFQ